MIADREPRLDRMLEGEDLALLGLGARAWLDRFAEAIEPRAPAPAPVNETLIAAALGLLSLRRSLLRWSAQAAENAPAKPARPLNALEGFLR